MPDPAIAPALAEIKAVLLKHDLAGVVFIGSRTHTEFLYALAPSWSSMKEEGDALRITAKGKDPETLERLRVSVGMLAGFNDAINDTTKNIENLLIALDQHGIKFQHWSRLEKRDGP